MVKKFLDFDEYQLAKYNKIKKPKKKEETKKVWWMNEWMICLFSLKYTYFYQWEQLSDIKQVTCHEMSAYIKIFVRLNATTLIRPFG